MDECENVIEFEEFEALCDAACDNMGQSESKKSAKRTGPETKGTAMSFGFKKKFGSSSNKKNANNLSNKEKEKEKERCQRSATVITNPGVIQTDNLLSDNNGNTGSMDSLNENEQVMGRTTPRLLPPKKDSSGIPYRQNRFGFRQTNIVRPASVGLTPKITTEYDSSNNNSQGKRRSKSATGARNLVSIKNTSQEQQQQQNLILNQQKNVLEIQSRGNQFTNKTSGDQYTVNSDMHTNSIVRPTPQTPTIASVSKFTLHTSSLPRPQYAVPISVTSSYVMDTKGAKQALNTSRRSFLGPRENSSDSGVASYDGFMDQLNASPTRRSIRNRPRNLEMVMSGRNLFQVRDLDSESLSDDTIIPLVLPKLPSAFNSSIQTSMISGLVQLEQNSTIDFMDDSSDARKLSTTSSDIESIDEEKAFKDRSASEKGLKNSTFKEYSPSSKNSSPASSRASSWCNAGESLAHKDYSSQSLSSSDESKENFKINTIDEDVSTVTVTIGNNLSSMTISSIGTPQPQPPKQSARSIFLKIEDSKFAEMAASNDVLIDDETSPTDSLVSSCTDSDDLISKKNKKKINDLIKEKEEFDEIDEIDEISPELAPTSPMSPGTPTHASNSFSLSDNGRDFLIDDEIEDQPNLVFDESNEITEPANNTSINIHSLTDTPTLMETAGSRPKPKLPTLSAIINESPKLRSQSKRSTLTRTESLDTLSPCESIASDDLMMDFDSSMDSIDKAIPQSQGSGSGSALHSMDETQLWSELEAQGVDVMKEWTSLLRHRQTSRESITSQLPARATRLLNRSRLGTQTPTGGSDSPRSLDSISSRRTPCRSQNFREVSTSPEDMLVLDKSLRNSMLQDVVFFKKQLVRLRRLLQEDEETLTRTDTLNPFENGQFFGSCGLEIKSANLDDSLNSSLRDDGSLTPSLIDDPRQELNDLRRQVVYLQSQMDDKDRTIRIQQNLIDKLEDEKHKNILTDSESSIQQTDVVNTATQTERLRPISMGPDTVSRSEQPSKFSPTFKKQIPSAIIKLPTTNKLLEKQIKPVRTTIIGNLFSSTNKSDKNIILNGTSLEKTNLNVQKINKSNSGVLSNLSISKNVKINGAASIKKIPTLIKCNKINPETNKNISSTNSSLHSSSSSLSENSPKLFIKNINNNNNNLNNNSIKEAALEVI